MPNFGGISISLREFTPIEKRDMLLYILGVMFFKFGSEAFNGSVVALATKLFDATGMGGSFGRLGVLQGLNLGMRCFGSIMVPPLIRRFASRDILSAACAVLGLTVAFVLIVDAASGGRFRSGVEQERLTDHHGDFHPDVMIPVYAILGFSNGMIDLVRSLIPRDMVGGNVEKLQKLDSLVSREPPVPPLSSR